MSIKNKGSDDDRFAARAQELLRRSNDELDAPTLTRLNQARLAAVQQIEAPAAKNSSWLPAGAMAAAVLAIALLWFRPDTGVDERIATPAMAEVSGGFAAQDIAVLMADESIDLLADLDFYSALDADAGDILLDEMDPDWSS